MTEEIERLLRLANIKDGDGYNTTDLTRSLQLFGELIIQECIKRIEGTSAPLIENMDSAQNYGYAQWWEGYDDRGADCIENIKKHFGIENETN